MAVLYYEIALYFSLFLRLKTAMIKAINKNRTPRTIIIYWSTPATHKGSSTFFLKSSASSSLIFPDYMCIKKIYIHWLLA